MHAAAVEKIHAHARRHPGFDVTCELDPLWDHRLRTVSWLTFVGPTLPGIDAQSPALRQLRGVTVIDTPTSLVLQAGDAPSAGDLNRLVVPEAYSSVDHALRAARASEGGSFPSPWRRDTVEAWLRRFERSVV